MLVNAAIEKSNGAQLMSASGHSVRSIAIASTFTAEPVEDPLAFWMDELGQVASIKFADYNQVFQQLLDPTSLLATNRQGVNVVLVRVEDWQRFHHTADSQKDRKACLTQNAEDLINAARTAVARSSTPLIVALCPNAPSSMAHPVTGELLNEIEQQIIAALDQLPNPYLVGPDEFRKYPVDIAYDPQRDQRGHIPYTSLFYAALGTILARKIHVLMSLPYKVIVLDCDNTIWSGVVGEDGIEGIRISEVWKQMQRHMVELSSKGFLLCLCSKNDEADVLDVFDKRPDMVLKRDHLVSWRINWQPKSDNIKSLAQELKLGLDSFIFLDDNPVECAEVRSACPEVLTLQFPKNEAVARFLDNVWPFDRLSITSEDQQRTSMYKQEIERARFQTQALTIDQFLNGLNLQVKLSKPIASQLSRFAQLTQRTNQFNFTTLRRTEAELQQILTAGMECRAVEVSDRFGDYGLVGAMVFSDSSDVLEVDTFLLSCRVLNRGVEHRMLNELGKIALERNLLTVMATVFTTKKNQPARDFLEKVAAPFREMIERGDRYRIPAALAAECVLSHASVELEPSLEAHNDNESASVALRIDVSRRYERIATELFSTEQVLCALQDRSKRARSRSKLDRPFVAPRTEIEKVLAELWGSLLRIEPVGVHDDFFELGGTSLRAVDLFAQIDRQFNQRLPLTSLIEAPTVEQFARLLSAVSSRDSMVLIREGGDKAPLFLVHDGDGETMLYRNLAMLLSKDHSVYGLQPHSQPNVPLAQTRISEMAAHHIDRIRSVQPHGPYLLGGMCAGGVIAYEIALQLQYHGETVAMVALLDAADVMTPAKTWRFAQQRIQSFSTVFHDTKPGRSYRSVLLISAKALRKAKNLITYMVGQNLKKLRDELRMRLFRFYLDRGLRLPHAVEQIPVRIVYLFAEKNYQPESLFHGELVLFRATCGEGPDEPYIERYADPLLGWSKRTSRSVRVYDVPGGHSSMLQEPNVRVLASHMQTYIDQVLVGELAEPADELSSMLAGK
jgi:FkbH-like protein